MGKIFLLSDLHMAHNREFIWKARGFKSVHEMNEAIVRNWNEIVDSDDDVYVLGDLMLGDNSARSMLAALKGRIHVILGNHDTTTRIEIYYDLWNVVEVVYATKLDYKGYHFFLSHYPCLTGNLEHDSLKKTTCNFFGHTHSKEKFYNDMPFMYNVACDAHGCTPVLIDDAIADMEKKVKECKSFL